MEAVWPSFNQMQFGIDVRSDHVGFVVDEAVRGWVSATTLISPANSHPSCLSIILLPTFLVFTLTAFWSRKQQRSKTTLSPETSAFSQNLTMLQPRRPQSEIWHFTSIFFSTVNRFAKLFSWFYNIYKQVCASMKNVSYFVFSLSVGNSIPFNFHYLWFLPSFASTRNVVFSWN